MNESIFLQHIEMANEMAIEDYKQVMRLALEGVHARHKSPQGLWLDSCHLIAYSLHLIAFNLI
jgi:hypothetical protein